jgi:SAM-dependent methyltransferase
MDERLNRIAALANIEAHDLEGTKNYIDGAPHIKHASLRALYAELLTGVYDHAAKYTVMPRVLDLGAGEGSVTLPFLELGARVTAVVISPSQLEALGQRCERFSDRLELRHQDVIKALETDERFDIVVTNSFLHHIPDYLGLIREAIALLSPRGQFFSFQDPLRYDTLGAIPHTFSTLSYFVWRVTKGDVLGGVKRRLRRGRGVYLADSMYDNAEYHVTRNGVDQDAIAQMFDEAGFDCDVVRYFSTQNALFQTLGAGIKLNNTFAIIARKRS